MKLWNCVGPRSVEVFQCAFLYSVFLLANSLVQKFFSVFYFQTVPILVLPLQRQTKLHTLKEKVVWLLNDLKYDSSVILGEAVCKTSLTWFVVSRIHDGDICISMEFCTVC